MALTMDIQIRINGQPFDLTQELCQQSETIKNLISDYPDQKNIFFDWDCPLTVDFNLVFNLLLGDQQTDDLLLFTAALIFADYLNLPVNLNFKPKKANWGEWASSFVWKKYPLLAEFQTLKEAGIFSNHLVKLLQKIDLIEAEASFLKAYYPQLEDQNQPFQELGFPNRFEFLKRNQYRTILVKATDIFVLDSVYRVDILIDKDKGKEWIVQVSIGIFYLNSKGDLKCLNDDNISSRYKGTYKKLFSGYYKFILESADKNIILMDFAGNITILAKDFSLDYVVTVSQMKIVVLSDKSNQRSFYQLIENELKEINIPNYLKEAEIFSIINVDDSLIINFIRDGVKKNSLFCISLTGSLFFVKEVPDKIHPAPFDFWSPGSEVNPTLDGHKITKTCFKPLISGIANELLVLADSGKLFQYNRSKNTLVQVYQDKSVTNILTNLALTVIVTL